MPSVYILKLINGKYYTGSTKDLSQRLIQHQQGKSPYTKKYLPVILIFSQNYSTISQAKKADYWLKNKKTRT